MKRESVYHDDTLLKPYEKEYKNYPRSVLKYSNGNHNSLHPTQKPLELWKYMILTYSNEEDIVFDPFAGSGTTAIACLKTGRKYICCEKEKNYFDIALERIKNEQNNQ